MKVARVSLATNPILHIETCNLKPSHEAFASDGPAQLARSVCRMARGVDVSVSDAVPDAVPRRFGGARAADLGAGRTRHLQLGLHDGLGGPDGGVANDVDGLWQAGRDKRVSGHEKRGHLDGADDVADVGSWGVGDVWDAVFQQHHLAGSQFPRTDVMDGHQKQETRV